ncbi:phospholipase D family protein [Chromobacterium haemolyticum]|uniref:phospholipase D family nuclease n=1 Tax=Chromobacterium haemolyticum TaxID=394935 RepID=UPI00244862B1|nr:phospholipase D family protein [Chromobacterium haemolyticum]MDH0342040.1 phospholipase D family protein [Chromobacterium haemolyticum]
MAKKGWLFGVVAMLFAGMVFAAQPLPAGASFDAGFSPRAGALDTVLKGISAAKQQILVAAYSFSSKPVATALLDAQRRGVKVFVVADRKDNSTKYSAAQFLANYGVPVRLNGNYAIFHHKFMVIDNDSLELGSFNYSAAAAERNAENVLLLWHVPGLADTYAREWKRLWDEAEPLPKAY